MSYSKFSTISKEEYEESHPLEEQGPHQAEIIPFPGTVGEERKEDKKRVRLEGKFLYYKGKKIPILHFQKAGYDKLLKLLVKEIGG
ncbi:MAG: hypothetical protein JXB26_20450 [Candidatus Aminicenantes bacterium]|nr:hypothetical protein [Candidatus Aminicenantes bacterium]